MAPRDQSSSTSSHLGESEDTEPLIETTAVPHQCCSARLSLAVMMFFGFAIIYGLRINLSVAMVAMVTSADALQSMEPARNSGSVARECPLPPRENNISQTLDRPDGVPQYPWDAETQGWLMGAFFFGYLCTQIPGGYLSGHYGGSVFLGGGVLATAVLSILTPLAAQLGSYWLFALRSLEGFGEGVTFPAMMAMWQRWAPPVERSRLITLSDAGANFGAFVTLPLTAYICQTLGWPAVFYICGGAGCLWSVFWFILVSDDPRTHRRISEEEREYIISAIGPQGSAHSWSIPLLPIVLSAPLWAIIVTQMCYDWVYYTLLTSVPTYMNNILHFDLKSNAFLSAVPYLGAWLVAMISGLAADSLIERERLSVTAVRKIFTLMGLLLPGVSLVAVAYAGCSATLAVAFLSLCTTIQGTGAAGIFMNQIDIAPRYAGVLLGITNTIGSIPGVVAPIVTGYLTTDNSVAGWRNVFWVSAVISVFGGIFYTVLGSGEIQTWALTEEDRAKLERNNNKAVNTCDV